VAFNVGIGAGKDVFIDPCFNPPKKSFAHDVPPI
jgi:hypothetical protein